MASILQATKLYSPSREHAHQENTAQIINCVQWSCARAVRSAQAQGTKTIRYATLVHTSHFPGSQIAFVAQSDIIVLIVACSCHGYARRALCVT
jgi:cytosine/adenosine deaminase-related metal-dependent hydrolase